MSYEDVERVVEGVGRFFSFEDYYLREDGSVEFKLSEQPDMKERFLRLHRSLKAEGRLAVMSRMNGEVVLVVGRRLGLRRFSKRTALILFLATLTAVVVQGWVSANIYTYFAPHHNSALIAFLYVLGLLGIIGLHETGHLTASRRHGMASSLPYFIPGIPLITPIPTFGAVIVSGEPAANRDELFDLGVSGPLTGFVVTVLVAVLGAMTSVVMPKAELEKILKLLPEGVGTITYNPSIMQTFIYWMMGRLAGPDEVLIDSPVGFAAWLGFLITFLNLLPAWQLDGGHMARAVLGREKHRFTTMLSILLLIALGYWLMALLILFFSTRTVDYRPLDDVSPLSRGRKLAYVLILILAVLSAPAHFLI